MLVTVEASPCGFQTIFYIILRVGIIGEGCGCQPVAIVVCVSDINVCTPPFPYVCMGVVRLP